MIQIIFHSRRVTRLASLSLSLLTAFALATVSPAGAQGEVALGTADESAIAVPFLGDYEVWCTDRNPAPNNLCSSHHGSPAIDLGMVPGTPLNAAGSGVVIEADSFCPASGSCNNGKGNVVVISHSDGSFSRYLHMADVSVVEDQIVTVGDPIGTSGASGQSSSPHLHYDEHFPFGTRTDMGKWVGCVDGQQVIYPDVFGTTDWNDVEYGSRIVNDSFDCLDGVDVVSAGSDDAGDAIDTPEATPQARIIPGTTHFAVTPPSSLSRTLFEVSVDVNNGSGPKVTALSGTAMVYLPAPTTSATVLVRENVGGQWQPWSSPLTYTPGSPTGPTCYGLLATTDSLTGTPDVDVIIGTNADDQINARAGHDVICAGSGNDTVIAGLGNDVVFGGVGNDTISGGKGADQISAEAGEDTVRGGTGADTIHGGAGNDILHGTAGNDRVEGGNGDDIVIGGIGHDVLRAGAGNDVLEGRNGRDNLGGGKGLDSNDGGNGNDKCFADVDGLVEVLVGCER